MTRISRSTDICRGGINPRCRECINARVLRWKREHSALLAAGRRAAYANGYRVRYRELEMARAQKTPLRVQSERLWGSIRERAKEKSIPVGPEIGREFIENWLRQPNCECCGVQFLLGARGRGPQDRSPSFDRFRPGGGYLACNMALICWRCNNIKRNYCAADLRRVAAWMDVWGNQTDKFPEVAA